MTAAPRKHRKEGRSFESESWVQCGCLGSHLVQTNQIIRSHQGIVKMHQSLAAILGASLVVAMRGTCSLCRDTFGAECDSGLMVLLRLTLTQP